MKTTQRCNQNAIVNIGDYQYIARVNYVFLHISARLRALRQSGKLRAGESAYLCCIDGREAVRKALPSAAETNETFLRTPKTKDYGNQLFNRGKKEPQPARRGRTKFRDKAQASGASTGRRKTGRKPRRLERITSGR